MKLLSLLLFIGAFSVSVQAQDPLTYQKPPKEILDLVNVPLAPSVWISDKDQTMLLRYRDNYKSIETLSEKEMRLGGLRINPKTNISSRITYYHSVEVRKIKDSEAQRVNGMPRNARLANFQWSPDYSKVAFTNTTQTGVELWVLDMASATAKRLTDPVLNANMGNPATWYRDGSALLVKFLAEDRKPLINTDEAVPTGPTVSVSTGSKAQNRTYQDLLKNPNDEHNFEQLALSQLYKVDLDGNKSEWAPPAMYRMVRFSPNGEYVLVSAIQRPFSYLVPYSRFPFELNLHKSDGEVVKTVNKVPLVEDLPKGFMAVRTGQRSTSWRSDKPATLVWAEALDGGDPAKEVEYRDQAFELEAPFTGRARTLIKTKGRYSGIAWADDKNAFAYDYWWNTRNTKMYWFNPSDNSKEAKILVDRNYQDRYSDPGRLVSVENEFNIGVIHINDGKVMLSGDGYTKEGQFPFIDEMDLASGKTTRLYQSNYKDKVETIYDAIDINKGTFLVRLESPTEYPNFYIRSIGKKEYLNQITHFENPFKAIENVHKEVIKYKRYDGLELSATMYLPVGYDKEKKDRMPMVLWAYPTEFKDKNSASQTTANPNEFTYPYYGSMVYWVTRGYVVLDAAFPIVGEGDAEPNDDFRKQLVGNAKAAIDAVDELGYVDPKRCAVSGHSYGAFMTANLLSHSNLFAAGIARSGAYNRTLTPFGFQSEERSYWEAPEVYYKMSPFMHADKMKTPLLLIHGQADNNSGTYPLQSERYFNALKGLGATARLVMLPKESHGYRAKESILHMLWEQDQWLEKYVKNRDLTGETKGE